MPTTTAPAATWKFAALPLLLLTFFPLGSRALTAAAIDTVDTLATAPATQAPIAADRGGGSCQGPAELPTLATVTPMPAPWPSAVPAPRRRHLPGDEGCRETPSAATR